MTDEPKPALPEWGEDFLDGLQAHGSVYRAAVGAGVRRVRAYQARDEFPELAARWEEILNGRLDSIAATTLDRAEKGWTEETVSEGDRGTTTTTRKLWDPNLAKWVLERRRPKEWGKDEDDLADAVAKRIVLDPSGEMAARYRGELEQARREIEELRSKLGEAG